MQCFSVCVFACVRYIGGLIGGSDRELLYWPSGMRCHTPSRVRRVPSNPMCQQWHVCVCACVVYVYVRVFVCGLCACVTRYLIGKRIPHAPHCCVVSVCNPRSGYGPASPQSRPRPHHVTPCHPMLRSPHTRLPRDWKGWVATPLTDRRGGGRRGGGGWNVPTWTAPGLYPPAPPPTHTMCMQVDRGAWGVRAVHCMCVCMAM